MSDITTPPSGGAVPAPVPASPAPTSPSGTASSGAAVPVPSQAETSMAKAKKMILLIGIVVGLLWGGIIALGLSMVGEGGQGSSLANLLGSAPREAIASFSMFTYTGIALAALGLLISLLISLFQLTRTPKDDPTHGSKLAKTIASGVGLFVILIGWIMIFSFLSSRTETFSTQAPKEAIITIPKDVLGLSAPVAITFDATGFESKINIKKLRILSYVWDFGDGNTATGPLVTHDYLDKGKNSGVFIAQLTVTMQDNTGKQVTDTNYKKTISIKNIKPTVTFTASQEKGPAPLKVTFDAGKSVDPDGQITAYAWDLDGDGTFTDGTGKIISKTYTENGIYQATLQLTDNSGEVNTAKKTIEVADNFSLKPVIDVNAEVNGKLFRAKPYLFDAKRSTSAGEKIMQYSWNFGDGTPAQTGRNVQHAFAKTGSYEVILTVTDAAETSSTSKKKVMVTEATKSPVSLITSVPPAINGRIVGASPLSVEFDATKNLEPGDDLIEYAWDFESDGTFDAFGAKTTHVFPAEGTYAVTLKVTDSDNSERTSKIEVDTAPPGINAKINATPITGTVPLTVKFDASASTYLENQIISYEWDFGDGTPKRQDAAKIAYKYAKVGLYTAKVTVIGSDGKKSTNALTITVQNVPVKACFTPNRNESKAPAEFIFNADCTTGTIAKYGWDLDNNGSFTDATGTQVNKTFETPGSYIISLEVTDNQGVVDIFTDTVVVTSPVSPPAAP